MIDRIDCDVRIANHTRQIARVNASAWQHPSRLTATRTTMRVRLGTFIAALDARLAAAPAGGTADLVRSGDRAA